MSIGTVQRNDDGSYTSSAGYTLTKGPDGQLYSGGAPTGLSAGIGGGVVPTSWGSGTTDTVAGGHSRAATGNAVLGYGSGPQRIPSFLSLPVYLWMAMLGILAGLFVSGPSIPDGLRLHPAYGVAAGFAVIAAYRYLMTWLPTALVVGVASAVAWGLFVWIWLHAAEARMLLPPSPRDALGVLPSIAVGIMESVVSSRDIRVPAALLTGLALHAHYWRHRRGVVRQFGCLFTRGLASAAKVLLCLTITAVVLGQLIVWAR
jgi:hypothetical protein